MGVLVRAVVYGFGFSLGAALYKKVSCQLGLDESQTGGDAATSESNDDTGDAADGAADGA
jgi:hypothetical protein